MFYAWLYTKKHPECTSLKSGIYPLRSHNNNIIVASWNVKKAKETKNKKAKETKETNETNETLEILDDKIPVFETMSLTPTLEEILDPKKPFAPIKKNAENGPCKYCPMVSLCMLPSKPTADAHGDDSDQQNNAIE